MKKARAPLLDFDSVKLTVIIPTCERLHDLARCLESLDPRSQGVSTDQVEFVVTDDGRRAVAETLVRAQYSWARWCAGPQRGPAANRNRAAREATGEWLAFIDDDCVATAGWLRALLAEIERDAVEVIEGRTTIPARREHPFLHGVENTAGGCLWSCNLALRRSFFQRVGGFDEEFQQASFEDLELAWRLKQHGACTLFLPAAEVEHPQRYIGWSGFFRRAPMLKWALLYFLKSGQAAGPETTAAVIVCRMSGWYARRLLCLIRDACHSNEAGEWWPGFLNAFANWLIAPFQFPYLLWWEFAFRRRAARNSVSEARRIHPRDVSVVVQGPMVRRSSDPESDLLTRDVLASVRRFLPEAEVILSTWAGEETAGLDFDVCVQSEDPGAVVPNPDFPTRRNNVNRQIVSTSAGLGRATRPYAVKLRTDTPLLHAGFLDLLRTAPRHPAWRLLRERIVVARELSLHPAVVPSLYHASDFFQFGRTEDLRELWRGPLAPEPETSQAFSPGAPPPLVYNVVEGPSMRMSAEQYVLVSFLRTRGIHAAISYICDCRLRQTVISLLFTANAFAFARAEEIGVQIPRRITESPMSLLSAESEAWTKTTALLATRWSAWCRLPFEIARVRLKWWHFWVRYSLKPRWRVWRGVRGLAPAVRS